MLKAVCWGICLCVFVQSIEGKSIDFNSGYQDFDDKSTYLQAGVRENEQIEDDHSNGALKAICNYARIPLDIIPDSYLNCIQKLLEENRNIRLRKRSVEDDNTVPEVSEDNNNGNTTDEDTATSEKWSDELIVPAESSLTESSENAALSVSEVKPQESVTANTSSDDIILPAINAVENTSQNSSLPVDESTDHNVENPNIIPEKKETTTTERLANEPKVPAEVANVNGSKITLSVSEVNPQEPSMNKTSSDEVMVPPKIAAPEEVATEKSLKTSTLAVSEVKPQEPATNRTSSDEVIEPTEIAIAKSSENPSLSINQITDKSLSNNSLLTQESNILNISNNTLKMLNSGETSDSTSLNSTTDTPVLFKNGFDDILKNTPGKQHNISINEGEIPKGKLGSIQMQTVLLEVSKNDSSKTIEGGEISKAGESQEKSTSSPNNILLIVFAILGVVGTLAFAFNYIKKRREDREVNEMIKLEEEGRELKEIKPLMKSNFVQNGSKSLEYIDADPQLQVETETKDEKN